MELTVRQTFILANRVYRKGETVGDEDFAQWGATSAAQTATVNAMKEAGNLRAPPAPPPPPPPPTP